MPESNARADVTVVTATELLYLLSLDPEPNGDVSRRLLHLGEAVTPGTPLYQAGASGLAARGLVSIEGENLVPSQSMQGLTRLLTTSTRWVTASLAGDGTSEMAVFVTAGEYSALLTRNRIGVYSVLGLEGEGSVTEAVTRIAAEHFAKHDNSGVTVDVIEAPDDSDETDRRAGAIRRDGDSYIVIVPELEDQPIAGTEDKIYEAFWDLIEATEHDD